MVSPVVRHRDRVCAIHLLPHTRQRARTILAKVCRRQRWFVDEFASLRDDPQHVCTPLMRISTRTKVIVSVLLVFLTGWNLYANGKNLRDRNIADRTVLFVTAPIQKALTWCVNGVGCVFSGYVDLVGVRRENQDLAARLDGWDALETELRELELENQRLRELTGLRERLALDTVSAEVIGWGTSSRFRVVRIDRGRATGLAPGQRVIGAHGAVGQVLHTSAGAADVLLLSDVSSNVAVRFQETRLRGILRGNGRWGAGLELIARQDVGDVSEQDLLVTSGDDGVFPAGIPAGRVSYVLVEETGHFLTVDVVPVEQLASLHEVMVLVGAPPGTDVELVWMPPPMPEVPAVVAEELTEPGEDS